MISIHQHSSELNHVWEPLVSIFEVSLLRLSSTISLSSKITKQEGHPPFFCPERTMPKTEIQSEREPSSEEALMLESSNEIAKTDSENNPADRTVSKEAKRKIAEVLGLLLSKDDAADGPMMAVTREVLEGLGLRYKVLPALDPSKPGDRHITYRVNSSSCGSVEVVVDVASSKDRFAYVVKTPTYVPEAQRINACVYLTYVNYDLSLGNFELDLRDGEVRFKNSCCLVESKLSKGMVSVAVGLSHQLMDQFFPGLMAVVYGGKLPKEAYEACMKSGDEEKHENGEAQ